MTYEVERKFRVTDAAALERRLLELGAQPQGAVRHADQYFAHPAREFRRTDEALRLRQVGSQNFVTYKGPKIDPLTKTRCEIELPLAPGEECAAQMTALLAALGFQPIGVVRKTRRTFTLALNGRDIEAALDDVEGLGVFAEIETIAQESQLDDARASLAQLAEKLQLDRDERRGYLEMLLAQVKQPM